MASSPPVTVDGVSHSYGDRVALDGVALRVEAGEVFGLLGPNGGGKTTLFRILSTLIPIARGSAAIFGHDLRSNPHAVRREMGVIFQSPSLDKKLTVLENLGHQGRLYGLSGTTLMARIGEMLERVRLTDRAGDLVEKLSGGLQRRVEVAKSLLHRPKLLLLDEPTTGLDPGARKDLWDYLAELKRNEGTTVLVTTHLMDEAERCDRLAILDRGRIVAQDTPDALRKRIGGEVIIIQTNAPEKLREAIQKKFGGEPRILDDTVRVERADGHRWIGQLMEAFAGEIETVTIGRPTLEDVFVQLTGHRFWAREPKEDGK